MHKSHVLGNVDIDEVLVPDKAFSGEENYKIRPLCIIRLPQWRKLKTLLVTKLDPSV